MPRFQANRRILALLAAFFFVTTLYFCTTRLSAMDLIRQPLREAAAPAVRAAAGPQGDAAQAALQEMSRTEGEHMSHEGLGGGDDGDADGRVEAEEEEGQVKEADSLSDGEDEAEEEEKVKDAKVLEEEDEKEEEEEKEKEKEKEEKEEKKEKEETEEEKKKDEEKQDEKGKEEEVEHADEQDKDEEKEAKKDGHDRLNEEGTKEKHQEQPDDKAHEKMNEEEDQDFEKQEIQPKDDQDVNKEEEAGQELDSQTEKAQDKESTDSSKQSKTGSKDHKAKPEEQQEEEEDDDDVAQEKPSHGLLLHAALPEKHVPTAANGKRLLIIGDIHGMLKPLRALLRKAGFDPSSDHIISVGDMVNKGPSSAGVVALLMKHAASAVRGNHEDRVLLALNASAPSPGPSAPSHGSSASGSKADAQALETARGLSDAQVAWLEGLPAILSIGQLRMHVVHAGMLPGVRPEDQPAWAVMNMRTLIREQQHARQKQGGGSDEEGHDVRALVALETREGEKWARAWNRYQRLLGRGDRWTVVYGHDAKRGLREERYSIGLDSGCVKGGALTGLVVEAGEGGSWRHRVVQVRCEDDDDEDDDE